MRQNKIVIILLIAIGLSIYIRFGVSDTKSGSDYNTYHPYLNDISSITQTERMAEYWAKDIVKNGKIAESEVQKAKQLYADCIRNEAAVFKRTNNRALTKAASTDYITFMTKEFEKRCESTILALIKDIEENK